MAKVLLVHPIAALFPALSTEEQAALTADIKANGLHRPIDRFDGMILDGRHRQIGCDESGVKPVYRDLSSDSCDPFAHVISMNLRHRHLAESQRIVVAHKLAEMQLALQNGKSSEHRETKGETLVPIGTKTAQTNAAKALNVGVRSVQRAAKVASEGTPELIAAMQDGSITPSDAAAIADKSPAVQRKAVERVKSGEAATARAAVRGKRGKPTAPAKATPSVFHEAHTYFGRGVKKIDAIAKAKPADKFSVKASKLLSELLTCITDWQKATR